MVWLTFFPTRFDWQICTERRGELGVALTRTNTVLGFEHREGEKSRQITYGH